MLEFGPQLKGITVYRQGSRGNEPLTPITGGTGYRIFRDG